MNKTELDSKIIKINEKLIKKGQRFTRDYIRKYYKELENEIRKIYGTFQNLYNTIELQDKEVKRRVNTTIIKKATSKKYIISSVIEGAPINYDFFKCLQHYCKVTNSELILLWMRGANRGDYFDYKDWILVEPYLCTEIQLNNNLRAIDTQAYPIKRNPLTGLHDLCSRKHSLIISSPRQFLESIPRPRGVIPHILLSTGTISEPEYNTTESGYLAKEYNKLGAVVVEIENKEIFYARQVQYKNDGFVDLGYKYSKDKVNKIPCEAMVLGDLHIGQHSENAMKISLDQIKVLKPKKLFVHDMCDFLSINHHDFHKPLTIAKRPKWAMSLESELNYVKEYLKNFCNKVKSDIYVVYSNHSDFLNRWLNAQMYIEDSVNIKIGSKFFNEMLQDINPIEKYLNNKRLHFLTVEDRVYVEDYLVSEHGHLGSNGSRGNIKNLTRVHNNVIIGHCHQPKIFNNAIAVGTNSHIKMNYTSGPTSWLHANCAIFKGGYAQLYIEINNKWKK